MTTTRFLKMTLGVDLVLVAVLLVATYLFATPDALMGVAVGGGLGTVNLVGLAWLCGRLVSGEGVKWPWALGLALKFALLIGLVFLAVSFLSMDVVGFVAGLSASGLAMVIGTSWLAVRNVDLTT
jgi:hypothetical protein